MSALWIMSVICAAQIYAEDRASRVVRRLNMEVTKAEGRTVMVLSTENQSATDADMSHLKWLFALKRLELCEPARITPAFIESIQGLRYLESVTLYDIRGLDDDALVKLSKCRSIQHITIRTHEPIGARGM